MVSARSMQLHISPRPACSHRFKHAYCLPWEAIAALRQASAKPSVCNDVGHDVYVYMEGDIIIPSSSFNFWHKHAEYLYSKGHVLMPLRSELRLGKEVLSDCFGERCRWKSLVLQDRNGPHKLYPNVSDRFYLKMTNAYSASWMLTHKQFKDYLSGAEWDFDKSHYLNKNSLIREGAGFGLLADPRLQREGRKDTMTNPQMSLSHAGLAHLQLLVTHQVPARKTLNYSGLVQISHFESKIKQCSRNILLCPEI